MKRVIATLLLLSAPAQAQVSSTAAPVANSSGSVTNQAVQVVPGKNLSINTATSAVKAQASQSVLLSVQLLDGLNPYESYYDEPVYDTLDLVGAFDSEGNAIPDGVPDNPGNVLYYRPIRTGQKNNYSINGGITATLSIPLDRAHIKSCHRAAEKQVAL